MHVLHPPATRVFELKVVPTVSGLDGVWDTASEGILRAVLETVDDVSRYRVSSHLNQSR